MERHDDFSFLFGKSYCVLALAANQRSGVGRLILQDCIQYSALVVKEKKSRIARVPV